ncbi:phosphatase PAP2 family protein [Schaalia vaccimaxillae]|uniref:phosphatase PAP2 family protein n=1 Tax=Schaalia vaccimaxillae TaxID=183916 RepID=UPI0003B581BD|nr:phosphatase PAP2 family protein [Schaalia vaccimaxillae]
MSSQTRRSIAPTALDRRALVKEVSLVALCAMAYSILCNIAPITAQSANAHARQILRIEDLLGLDIELSANLWLQRHPVIAESFAIYYSVSFFALTFGALLLIWFQKPEHYHFSRNVLFIMTGAAMVTYWVYPLAPPRLLSGTAFVDSVAQQSAFGSGYSQLYSALGNPYAAMPSMHTGWSIWVAVCLGLFVWKAPWQRLLLAIHPALTIIIVITTGNHYILDAVAGALYFLGAFLFVRAVFSNICHSHVVTDAERQATATKSPTSAVTSLV